MTQNTKRPHKLSLYKLYNCLIENLKIKFTLLVTPKSHMYIGNRIQIQHCFIFYTNHNNYWLIP